MTDLTPLSDEHTSIIAGRDSVYARLQQQILDPSDRHALVYTGHRGMGKSALLQHFPTVFDDTFLSIFTPLSSAPFSDEKHAITFLLTAINQLLTNGNFSLSRVPELDPETDTPLEIWFRDTYLPEVIAAIRAHRRIVWLVDDGEKLASLGTDFLSYLKSILDTYPQFAIVMTISTDHEATLSDLVPLVSPVTSERLHLLSSEDTADLIRHYASGANDDLVTEIFDLSGGHPLFVERYGKVLASYWADHQDSEAFARTKPDVYAASKEDFRQIWLKLSRDERLVLTAIASLIYDDPLKQVTAARIEAWLIETDYLLDLVTISAALRGLDYQDIVNHNPGESITLTMSLMQQWLLEQARLDDASTSGRSRRSTMLLVVLAIIIVIVLLAILLMIPPQYLDRTSDIATATLAS